MNSTTLADGSTRMVAGNPTCRQTSSSTSTTSAPRKLNRGSSTGEKRENVSTTVNTRPQVPEPAGRYHLVVIGAGTAGLVSVPTTVNEDGKVVVDLSKPSG